MTDQLQLIERLNTLRKVARRRLFACGMCAVLSGGVVAFLTIVFLDWLLWFPPVLRMAIVGLFIAGFILSTLHWIVRPMQARLGIDEIAARVEAHLGSLQDRLSSTVNFLERRMKGPSNTGSDRMMAEVIANTERAIADMPLESALSIRPVTIRGIALAVSTAFFIGIILVAPSWPQTGLYRYVYPLGEIEWPRTVSIAPLTGDQSVPLGESATVRMQVQRGLTESLRGVVHLRETGGRDISLAMQREESDIPGQPGDTYYAVIDAVVNDLTYWFEAGDATTARRPFVLRVVRRPQILETLVAIEPPPYASNLSKRVHDLDDGPVNAPIGGFVTITIRSSKAVSSDSKSDPSGLRIETGELIPFSVRAADRTELSTRLEVRHDLRFWIELRDEDGFDNRGAAEYAINAVGDTPPVVTVLEPQAFEELTPIGSVQSVIRVEDDFGVVSADLVIERSTAADTHTLPLTEYLTSADTAGAGQTDGSGVERYARRTWRLDEVPMGTLTAGDVIVYTAVARDNRASPNGDGQIGRSTTMRIRIISELEFNVRLRSDLAMLQGRIRQIALDQAGLLDESVRLQVPEASGMPLTLPHRETAAELAAQQARLARRLRELADRFSRLTDRMVRNRVGNDQSRGRIESLGRTLQEVAAEPMTAASMALSRAREHEDTAGQWFAVREATELQELAVEHLHAVLRAMSQWGSFQELLTKTRDILDRQRDVRQETAETSKTMIGKPIETLTELEAAALKRVQRKQQQLLADVEQLLAGMREQAEISGTKDPVAADAIDSAMRAARAHDVTTHMKDAVADLETNRTAAANISQRGAETAIRKMVHALRERETHQLEELRKHIAQAEHQLRELIEQQQALRAATHEASTLAVSENDFQALAQEQRRLKRNTDQLGDELADAEVARSMSPGTGVAARLIQQAVSPQNRAETEIEAKDAAAATIAQDEAIGLLLDAMDRLEELARQADDEVLRRSLAQIREDLEATLEAQVAVNDGIGKLKTSIEQRGRIARREARTASRLARQQADVRMMIDAQSADFERVVVYKWALDRVSKWMEESRQRLSQRAIDEPLVSLTDRVVHDLRRLLQAIADTESLPVDSSFVESDGGGGSGRSGTGPSKPVPTVAELLVLKAMQKDINERTASLHRSLNNTELSEDQLRDMRTIGEDQADVQRLTEMVTRRLPHQ